MASMMLKKPCSMCPKGVGILTCDGCQQSFCAKHIGDHRQELSVQMETVGQEYDVLRQDLVHDESASHPLFSRIDDWEQQSIRQIQQNAQRLRDDLRAHLNRNRDAVKDRCKTVTTELQTSRESGDYTEHDLRLWTEKLNELRRMLNQQTAVDLVQDKKPLVQSYTLKMEQKSEAPATASSHSVPPVLSNSPMPSAASGGSEALLFHPFVGNAVFSVNRLIARHAGDPNQSTMVCLNQLFTAGTHQIRFRIEQKTSRFMLFGILQGAVEMTREAFRSPSLYGWMSFDYLVVQSRKAPSFSSKGAFEQNDELTMDLNCKAGIVTLARYATNTVDRLHISFRQCPLPWRVVIAFFNRNDSVRFIGRE